MVIDDRFLSNIPTEGFLEFGMYSCVCKVQGIHSSPHEGRVVIGVLMITVMLEKVILVAHDESRADGLL